MCTCPKIYYTKKKSHFLNKNYVFHKDLRCSCKGKPPWGMWFERRRFEQAHLELNLGLLCGGGAVFRLALVGMECTPSTGKKGHIVPVSAAQPQTASESRGAGGTGGWKSVSYIASDHSSLCWSPSVVKHTWDNQHDCSDTIVRWKDVFLVHLKCLILFDWCLVMIHSPSIIQHLRSVQVHDGPQSLETNYFWWRNQISY